jgi:hypothetical protein
MVYCIPKRRRRNDAFKISNKGKKSFPKNKYNAIGKLFYM